MAMVSGLGFGIVGVCDGRSEGRENRPEWNEVGGSDDVRLGCVVVDQERDWLSLGLSNIIGGVYLPSVRGKAQAPGWSVRITVNVRQHCIVARTLSSRDLSPPVGCWTGLTGKLPCIRIHHLPSTRNRQSSQSSILYFDMKYKQRFSLLVI